MSSLFLLLVFLFFPFEETLGPLKDELQKLTEEDKQDLDHLFYTLLNEQDFSYTLFGDKPVSLGGGRLLK